MQAVKPVIGGALLSVLLYMTGIFVFLTPLPLLYGWLLRGRRVGLTQSGLSALVMLLVYFILLPLAYNSGQSPLLALIPGASLLSTWRMMTVSLFGVGYFFYYVVIALLLGIGLTQKYPLSKIVSLTLMTVLIGTLFSLFVASALFDIHFIQIVRSYFEAVMDQVVAVGQQGQNGIDVAIFEKNRSSIIGVAMKIFPGTSLAMLLLVICGNLALARWMVRKKGLLKHLGQLNRWQSRSFWIWSSIVSGIIFYIGLYTRISAIQYVALNVLIVLLALYALQGLSILFFFLQRNKRLLPRFVFFALVIVMPHVLIAAIILVGFLDYWLDVRRLNKKVADPLKI